MRRIGIVGDSPTIKWDSESGKSYSVWLSANLFDWAALPGTIIGSATGVNSWTDDGSGPFGPPSAATGRFYRIEKLP